MSTVEPRVWHYITTNDQTRVPRSIVVLDTEAREHRITGGHEQEWRLAVAWFYKTRKGRKQHEHQSVFYRPIDLWGAVSDHCGRSGRTVVWAHNLGYDARISSCFVELPQLGWSLAAHNIAPRGTWLVWKRERATLTMVDTASVWPLPLATIGQWFGLGKPDLPSQDDSDEAWVHRCKADVAITRTAVMTYLDWIESADMGNWQLTGAGQSWSAFRHKFMRHNLLVHGDEDALAAERRAMWTGRCEAYWHGTIGYQVVHEWDLQAAYARCARDLAVPVRLLGPMPPSHDWARTLFDSSVALLAEVSVTTDVPTVPCLHDGRILWPTGTFQTTLWDVEIKAAIDDGATVTVKRGWLYRTAPALRDWADWVLAIVDPANHDAPPWLVAIVKHWSRALIGRFAMRYSQWERWAQMPHLGAERRTLIDEIEGATYDLMHVGADLWRETGTTEWAQSMPAITGYVMAVCRIRLWRIIQQMPSGSVLYADTDSLILTDSWKNAADELCHLSVGEGLRLKTSYRGFSILGPRMILTGTKIRMAGVPILAERVGRHDFAGIVWESLDMALRSGRPDVVRTSDRRWHVEGVDRRRLGPGVGWTRPYKLDIREVA
jgi:DNA polymerase family B